MKASTPATLALAALLAAAAGCRKESDDGPPCGFPNGVAAGDVTQDSAVLWTRNTASTPLTIDWSTDPTFATIAGSGTTLIPYAGGLARVPVAGLRPSTDYAYRFVDAAGHIAAGRFRTRPDAEPARGLRFGASGSRESGLVPCPALANAPARELDFFALLGDTIDAEAPIPADSCNAYAIRHIEACAARPGMFTLADLRASGAVLTAPGDLDIASAAAGGALADAAFANETARFANALRAFQDFAPLEERTWGESADDRTAGRPAFQRRLAYGSLAAVFLLDTRTFRDANVAPSGDPFDPASSSAFRDAALAPGRTMLGGPQFQALQEGLKMAHENGIWWKFVLLHEPAQPLGAWGGEERFEGFAAERADLLNFIRERDIRNVVFVSSHAGGLMVSDLGCPPSPGTKKVPSGAFEVATGPIASSSPFGPRLVAAARAAGRLTDADVGAYDALGVQDKDSFVRSLVDEMIVPLGHDPLGLEGSGIDAALETGGYVAAHACGWSEFEIDPATRVLTVTAYGIDPYSEADLATNPEAVLSREPAVICRFRVTPKPVAPQPPSDGGTAPVQCWASAGESARSDNAVLPFLLGTALLLNGLRVRRAR